MSIYGKIDYSGMKDEDQEPCPRYWDESRKCWSDSWKEHLFDFEIKNIQQRYEEMNLRVADKLANPRKLIEIADFGINNPDLATCAFGEILEQINHTN
jgi:hypothetical protein